MIFFERTCDVICSPELLEMLKLNGLLHFRDINVLDYLTTDEDVLEKRGRVFRDLGKIPQCAETIAYMTKQLSYIEDMVKRQSTSDVEERNLYAIKQADLYFDLVERCASFWDSDGADLTSEDLKELFCEITNIRDSEEYSRFKKGAEELTKKVTRIKSISVGFNLDSSLSPYEAGILEVNSQHIESSSLVDRILRMDASDNAMSLAPLVSGKKNTRKEDFDALEQSVYRALSQIYRRAVRQWEPEINEYIMKKLSFLLGALPSLRFILRIHEVSRKMREAGLKLTKPIFFPKEEKVFRAKGLYNPILAMRIAEKEGAVLIRNDFVFDENGMIYLLTGPNNGGKSVFMSAVCIIQIMAQLGMEVPCTKLEISPAEGIFVHMANYSGLNQQGRLADECEKISGIFRAMPSTALCIFDEAYSSTDLNGALELSSHLLRALIAKGARGIFGTHFHELVRITESFREQSIDYLSAGLTSSGTRTYHIERGKSAGTSDAISIAERMGVTFEKLINQ